ncbi:hypothetical protein AC579_7621 [Pseudocercospora musae]|uniref:Uncharacterized protein n=1 Tax=Pseudocercospora musae TaxID=113226 RepID=A0A139GUV5_9PEZI|nr:hypothetical protein AC579_7621 [Pseudocercospora musae]
MASEASTARYQLEEIPMDFELEMEPIKELTHVPQSTRAKHLGMDVRHCPLVTAARDSRIVSREASVRSIRSRRSMELGESDELFFGAVRKMLDAGLVW